MQGHQKAQHQVQSRTTASSSWRWTMQPERNRSRFLQQNLESILTTKTGVDSRNRDRSRFSQQKPESILATETGFDSCNRHRSRFSHQKPESILATETGVDSSNRNWSRLSQPKPESIRATETGVDLMLITSDGNGGFQFLKTNYALESGNKPQRTPNNCKHIQDCVNIFTVSNGTASEADGI
jgi:hypothetical protein